MPSAFKGGANGKYRRPPPGLQGAPGAPLGHPPGGLVHVTAPPLGAACSTPFQTAGTPPRPHHDPTQAPGWLPQQTQVGAPANAGGQNEGALRPP